MKIVLFKTAKISPDLYELKALAPVYREGLSGIETIVDCSRIL